MKVQLLFLSLFLFFSSFLIAQNNNDSKPTINSSITNGLKLRNVSPGKTGGRITQVAIDPKNNSTRFAAVASGNIWRTKNAGTTWEPVFEHYGSYAVGTIQIDPNNSNIIWAGTGENNSQRSVANGDGIYKSMDGGDSWKNMGLKTSAHIGKIMIHPDNSNIVYVAVQGNLWKDGGERGLYKTEDGGKTWNRILHISENTGISDIIYDPRNPDILLVSSYQRRRHVGKLVAGGPNGGVWKSVDAGKTWNKLGGGLPRGDLGRIGLAISPQKPDVVYALVAGTDRTKGFYRSEDLGNTWTKKSDYMVVDAQYYMELFPDPHQFDKVYSVDVFVQYTEDGGKTFQRINERRKHVDSHDILFDKNDPDYILIACDGGIYESWDRTKTWRFTNNIPITQFYRVGIDNEKPIYNMYGGTQDNATVGVPMRTTNSLGIRNTDWFHVVGGDGFQARVDPINTNIIYAQSQYGNLVRFNKKTKERINIQPQPALGEAPLRWHWDSPLILSPHQPKRLYFAANKLFKSEDGGNAWTAVSDDLSRQVDRNKEKVMDKVWGIDAIFKNVWTSPYGTIVSLDESPLQEDLLYVGTDDGLVQISKDGGKAWQKVSRFPGVPERAYVADIHASRTDAATVFAVFNNHKEGDFKPYILKSNNHGQTWENISGDLPTNQHAWTIYQDHENANLLFVGTELGLYFTVNGGKSWHQLKGGMPTISIRDLEIQREENDLVAASFGRGFYVLEDYTPLRSINDNLLAKEAHLFPVEKALLYVEKNPDGYAQGHAFFTSPNPAFGAVFTYYLKDVPKTIAQQRKALESNRKKQNQAIDYPAWSDFSAEHREKSPQLVFSIKDASGEVIRRISKPMRKGLHRVNWDLRLSDGMNGGLAFVPPGQYSVEMATLVRGEWTDLNVSQSFDVVPLYPQNITTAQYQDKLVFHDKVVQLNQAIYQSNKKLEAALTATKSIQKSVQNNPKSNSNWYQNANKIQHELLDLKEVLYGNRLAVKKMELIPPSISSRLGKVRWNFYNTLGLPTDADQKNYELAQQAFNAFSDKLKVVLNDQLKPLKKELDGVGIFY
jgi:photosystem II stability/assembly factor-like uncharacterized protein